MAIWLRARDAHAAVQMLNSATAKAQSICTTQIAKYLMPSQLIPSALDRTGSEKAMKGCQQLGRVNRQKAPSCITAPKKELSLPDVNRSPA